MFNKRTTYQLHLPYFTPLITVDFQMDLTVTKRGENVSQRGECRAAEGTGPIAEGVKEPDKMEGGLLSGNARGNKDGVCGQKDDKEGGG